MIKLTNSIFNTFLDCPARAIAMYEGKIKSDNSIKPVYEEESTTAMACGSLVDAIVTKGFKPLPDEKVSVNDFYPWLESSYDDGRKNAELLVTKTGWNSYAKQAILSAYRLLNDVNADALLKDAEKQVKIEFMLDDETCFCGDIDILRIDNGTIKIIDLKAPSSIKGDWIQSGGKNVKASYVDAWGYWFQLSGYRYAFQNAKSQAKINGIPFSMSRYSKGFEVDTGLLYVTRSTIPQVGYIAINDYSELWRRIVKGRRADNGLSNLEIIKMIVKGEIDAPRCESCDCGYCAATSRVKYEPSQFHADDFPMINDKYGFDQIGFDIYADNF